MNSRTLRFPGGTGHELAALVSYPDDVQGWAIFSHCFTCNKNYKAIAAISKALNRQGFGVLRFDFTGLGESGGRFEDTSFSTNLDDLRAAVNFVAGEFAAPDFLIGHSLGGAASISVAPEFPSVRGVATLGTSADPRGLGRLFKRVREDMEREPERVFEVEVSGRPMPFKQQFLRDLERHDLLARVAALGKPLFVLHSPDDRISPVDNAEEIFAAAAQPKSFLALPGASHLLTEREPAAYTGEMLALWMRHCLYG